MFIREIWGKLTLFNFSKFRKSELGKFISNFHLEHVITSTNHYFVVPKYKIILPMYLSCNVKFNTDTLFHFDMSR